MTGLVAVHGAVEDMLSPMAAMLGRNAKRRATAVKRLLIALLALLALPVCSVAQATYSLLNNPTGTSRLQVSDLTTVASSTVMTPQVISTYSAVAPGAISTNATTPPLGGSYLRWQRTHNSHLMAADHDSHWRVGGTVELGLMNVTGDMIDFSWNVGSRISVSDLIPGDGALRLDVYRIRTGHAQGSEFTESVLVGQ